jgi:hypothetical protein
MHIDIAFLEDAVVGDQPDSVLEGRPIAIEPCADVLEQFGRHILMHAAWRKRG